MARRSSLSTVAIVVLVLCGAAAVALRWAAGRAATRAAHVPASVASPATRHEAASAAADALAAATPGPDLADPAWAPGDPLGENQGERNPWAAVDLAEIQRALPDNVYWKMAAPTKDPEVLRRREEERARWNVEYGKVISNTATDEEIDKFYAEKQRLSEDYLEFIVYLGTHYGDALGPRELAMLKLAGEMHHQRLEELPRKIREAHEAARQAWLEQQKEFAGAPPEQQPPAQPGQ
jgi:hypothetical protein